MEEDFGRDLEIQDGINNEYPGAPRKIGLAIIYYY